MAKCTICGKAIQLVPSAKERSERTGMPVSYYNNLFTTHSHCLIENRNKMTLDLIKTLTPSQICV